MDRSKLRSTLETSTNIALLLLAVAALSTFAINLLKSSEPPISHGLERGQVFGGIPKVDYRSNPQTLLIALNTGCGHCRDSLPFYRSLVELNQQSNGVRHIVAIFPNGKAEVDEYVKENHLNIESVSGVDLSHLRVSGTPTMILVNSNGEVMDFWVGKLDDSVTDKVIRSLTSENL